MHRPARVRARVRVRVGDPDPDPDPNPITLTLTKAHNTQPAADGHSSRGGPGGRGGLGARLGGQDRDQPREVLYIRALRLSLALTL